MKKLIILAVLLASACPAIAGTYSISAYRIDQDLYKDTRSGYVFKTFVCYEYTYGDDAVLK